MARKTTASGWVGWVYFAGALLLVAGGTQIIAGLVGIFHKTFFAVTSSGLVAFNYTAWGWMSLILGIIMVLAGVGIWGGATWARLVGVVLSVLAMLDNFAFITAYPLWSIIGIVLNGFVIYALTMHGAEVRE
jgi:hypothetical protein